MIINPDILRKDLVSLYSQIEAQIKIVTNEARELEIPPEKLRDHNGNWVMTPLLLAKVQVLHALIQLQYPSKK